MLYRYVGTLLSNPTRILEPNVFICLTLPPSSNTLRNLAVDICVSLICNDNGRTSVFKRGHSAWGTCYGATLKIRGSGKALLNQMMFSLFNWKTGLHPLKRVLVLRFWYHATQLHKVVNLRSRLHPLFELVVLVVEMTWENQRASLQNTTNAVWNRRKIMWGYHFLVLISNWTYKSWAWGIFVKLNCLGLNTIG